MYTLCVFVCACTLLHLYSLKPHNNAEMIDSELQEELYSLFSKALFQPQDTLTTITIATCCEETLDSILSYCDCQQGEVVISEIICCLAASAARLPRDAVLAEVELLCTLAVQTRRDYRLRISRSFMEGATIDASTPTPCKSMLLLQSKSCTP